MRRFTSILVAALFVLLGASSLWAAPPSTQARYIGFSNIQDVSATVSWINGNGAGRIVVISTDETFDTPISSDNYSAANGNLTNAVTITGGTDKVIGFTTGTIRKLDISGLTANTTYYIRIYEYNGTHGSYDFNTNTATNNPRSFKTKEAALTPPTALTVNAWSEGGLLSWTDAANAAGYYLTIYNNGTPVTDYNDLDIGKPDPTNFPILGLTANTAYTYSMVSYDAQGNRSTVATASFTTLAKPGYAITSYTPSSGLVKIGDAVTLLLTATNNQIGLFANTITVNSVDCASTLVDNGDGTYSITYTVGAGNIYIANNADLPLSITLKDGNNVPSYALTNPTNNASAPGIDGDYPTATVTAPANDSWSSIAISTITGTATDGTSSGVNKVEVAIWIDNDKDGSFNTGDYYWNGTGWIGSDPFWNLATGTTSWSYAIAIDPPTTTPYNKYYVQTRTTDVAENVTTIDEATYKFYVYNNNEVWVDDSYPLDKEGLGYVYFKTINNGINGVASNGEVNVAAGTYTEQVLIQKNLTLEGAGEENTIVKAPASGRVTAPGYTAQIWTTDNWNTDYLLAAYPTDPVNGTPISVKVSGFTFDADDQTHTGDRYTGVYFRKVFNDNIENAGLFNCTVKGFNASDPSVTGIRVLESSKLTLSGNTINDATIISICVYGTDNLVDPIVTTTGNAINPAIISEGIQYRFINGTTEWAGIISNNTITGGIFSISPVSSDHILVEGNTISGSANNGITIESSTNCKVYNNTISGCGSNGIVLTSLLSINENNTILKNTISGIHSGNISSLGACGWGIGLDKQEESYDISNNTIGDGTLANANDITNCDAGIVFWGIDNNTNTAKGNKIYGNTAWGVGNNSTSITVDATLNWWGDPTGPQHNTKNPCGQGNKVSDYVDFSPWYYDEDMTTKNGLATATLDPISNISTVTNTPVIIKAKVTYPSGISDFNTAVKVDGLVTSDVAFPTGAKIESIKYKLNNGAWTGNLITSSYSIEGKTSVYLSDVLGTDPVALSAVQGNIDNWEIVASGIKVPAEETSIYNLTFQAVSYITREDAPTDGCNTVLGSEDFAVTLARVTYTASLLTGCESITMESEATFPTINVDGRVLNDMKIESNPALPAETVIKCYSGSTLLSTYTLESPTDSILLSTMLSSYGAPFPLVGENGRTENWKFEISGANLAIEDGYTLTLSGIAVFDGNSDGTSDEYVYVSGEDNVAPYYQAPDFTTGAVASTGGTVVDGYYNSTNTGIDVVVPVPNNSLLVGGTIQIQISDDGTNWVNVATSGSHTIALNEINSNVTISLADGDLTANTEFTEGGTIHFRAIITGPEPGSCSTTGAASTTTIVRDETTPAAPIFTLNEESCINSLNQTTVSLGISGEANATVNYTIADNGSAHTSEGNLTLNGSGNGSATPIDLTAFIDGTITVSGTQTDVAGNVSASDNDTKNKDVVAPGITTLSAASDNSISTYAKDGQTITVSIDANENVTVTNATVEGNPIIASNHGDADPSTWDLIWTVVGGLNKDLAYSFTLIDECGNSATFNQTNATGQNVTIDNTIPSIQSIVRQNPTGQYTNANDVVFRVTFSEPVKITNANAFAFSGTITGTPAVNTLTGISGQLSTDYWTVWDVSVNGITNENGTLKLDLNGSLASVTDKVGLNPFAYTSGESYTIDNTVPSITIESPTYDGSRLASISQFQGTYSDANGVTAGNVKVSIFKDIDGDGIFNNSDKYWDGTGFTSDAEVKFNANRSGTDLTGNWTYNISLTGLTVETSFLLKAYATDVASNEHSVTRTFIIDPIPPEVESLAKTDNNTLVVSFDEPLDENWTNVPAGSEGSGQATFYAVTGTVNGESIGTINPTNATRGNGADANKVTLDFSGTPFNGILNCETLSILVTGVRDVAGNTVDPDNDEATYTEPDVTAPYVVSVVRKTPSGLSDLYLTNAEQVVYTVTFNEPVYHATSGTETGTILTSADFQTVVTGTASGTISNVSTTDYTAFDVTVDVEETSDGGTLTVAAIGTNIYDDVCGSASNNAFNQGSHSLTPETYTVDRKAPVLSSGFFTHPINSDAWNETSHDITWDNTYLTDGYSVDANITLTFDYSLDGSTGWTNIGTDNGAGSPLTWTPDLPDNTDVSTAKVGVQATDQAGNTSEWFNSEAFRLDNTAPTATITRNNVIFGDNTNKVTSDNTVVFTIHYSEHVSGTSESYPIITRTGTVTATEPGSTGSIDDSTITYTINNVNGDGTIFITAPHNGITDDAGNAMVNDVQSDPFTIDNTPATVESFEILCSDYEKGNLTFSEVVFTDANATSEITTTDLSVTSTGGNATLSGWTINSVNTVGNKTVAEIGLTWSGTPNGNEIVSVDVASDPTVYDQAGNAVASGSPETDSPVVDVTIETPPTAQEICSDGEATFTSTAATAYSSVIWQVSADGSTGWTDLTEFAPYSGTATQTLTITTPGSTYNGKYYRAKYTNACNNVFTSDAAKLTIKPNTNITTQPEDAIACLGSVSSEFTVVAEGSTLTYNWQYSTDEGSSWNNVVNGTPENATYSVGATGTLNVSGTIAAGTYNYRVVVHSECGGDVNSDPVTLTVNVLPTITLETIPSVCAGTTSANLAYTGTTETPNLYKIDFDATANTAGFVDVAYTTLGASPIVITIPGGANAGTYSAVLTVKNDNGCESEGNDITVTINPIPTITLGTNPIVCQGTTTANLTYSTTTGTPTQYTIDFDAEANTAGFADVDYTTLGASSIAIAVPETTSAGTYNATLKVANAGGCESGTYNISVTVNALPVPTISGNDEVNMNTDLTLTTQSGMTDYNWSVDGGTISSGDETNQIAVKWSTGGSKTVKVTYTENGCSGTSADFTVTVNEVAPPVITGDPSDQLNICSNTETVQFSVTSVSGTPTPDLTWQYSTDNNTFNDLTDEGDFSGVNTITLTVSNISAHTGYYRLWAHNSAGEAYSASAHLTTTDPVTPSVSIASSVADNTFCYGTSVVFTATASNTGGGTVAYQWKLNSSNVGSNQNTYTTATLVNNDQVSCVITITGGCVTSTTATSNTITNTVNTAPAQPSVITGNTTVCAGTNGVAYSVTSVNGVNYAWTYSGTGATINGTGASITIDFASNATSGTLTVTPSNGCGYGTARTLEITIPAAISYSAHPANANITEGQNTSFSATVSNATSYQWQVSTDNGTTWANATGGVYSGGTTTTLTLTNVPGTMNEYKYKLLSSNSCQSDIASNLATLNVMATEPTTQASGINWISWGRDFIKFSWTRGNGSGRLVIGKQATSLSGIAPTDGHEYSVSSSFGSGDPVGTAYALAKGGVDSVSVSGLQNNTAYVFKVFEYNGTGTGINYKTGDATGNPKYRKTNLKEAENEFQLLMGDKFNLTSLAPNPVKDQFSFEILTNEALPFTIEVQNELGITVYSMKKDLGEGVYPISIKLANEYRGQLPSGSYFLRVSAGGETLMQKFIYMP